MSMCWYELGKERINVYLGQNVSNLMLLLVNLGTLAISVIIVPLNKLG